MPKMTKLRKSAEGRECQIRVDGVCNGNPETVVLCHLGGAGMGRKQPDLLGAFGCSACHAWVDGGYSVDPLGRGPNVAKRLFYEGIFRTQQIWLSEGLVKCE